MWTPPSRRSILIPDDRRIVTITSRGTRPFWNALGSEESETELLAHEVGNRYILPREDLFVSTPPHTFPYRSYIMVKERKGLATGLLVGAFVGIVFDNIALGLLFGLLFGGAFDHQKKAKSEESE